MIVAYAQSFQLPQPLPPTPNHKRRHTAQQAKEAAAAADDDDLSTSTVTTPLEIILPMHLHQSTPCLPTTTMMT